MDSARILIERLVILKSNNSIYDEEFHKGINVIRGDHSVGKTTILELLFYVLGGEIKRDQWLYPADKCDEIYCQLLLNGKRFTIKRDIEKGSVPPISIRSGSYLDSNVDVNSWKSYGPRRNEAGSKMSFSQQVFELLGWDTHKTDDYANLTMHQLLRFMYVDQETASTKIFRAEDNNRADSGGIRTAISEFMLGLDNLDVHKLRQELIITEREFDKISSELTAMYRILGDDSGLTVENLESFIVENNSEIIEIRNRPLEKDDTEEGDKELLSKYKVIETKIDNINKKIFSLRNEDILVQGDIVDCEMFETSLKFRKKSLLESKASFDSMGMVEFEKCPCCYKPIEVDRLSTGSCRLCHADLEDVELNNNYMELLTEIDFQISSNKAVWDDYVVHIEGVKLLLSVSLSEVSVLKSELLEFSKLVNFKVFKDLEGAKRIGYLESKNEEINKKMKIIIELDGYKKRKVVLNGKLTEVRDKIELAQSKNKKRKGQVYAGISENFVSILKDERRVNGESYEEGFEKSKATDVEIDFERDRVLIDGRVKFSGSSNYIKKNAFKLSALLESLDDDRYRLPRFLMLDAIENGGMKEFRSHKFQKSIIDKFKGRDDFQLIFCTSMVLEKLNNDAVGVGPFYDGNVLQLK